MISQTEYLFQKEDINLHVFNIITRMNEKKKKATKLILCYCKCKLDVENEPEIKYGMRDFVDVSEKSHAKTSCE